MRTALILHLLGASIWVGGHLTLLSPCCPVYCGTGMWAC